jgi:hypothetical protein
MAEAVIALVAGLIGALVGLGGTVINLRHQRALELRKWRRAEMVNGVAGFLEQVNEIWRTEFFDGTPLDSSRGPWLASANAYDRASMVVEDEQVLHLLELLWDAMKVIRWEPMEEGSKLQYWDTEVWPRCKALRDRIRELLATQL